MAATTTSSTVGGAGRSSDAAIGIPTAGAVADVSQDTERVHSVCMHPTKQLIAFGCETSRVKVWSLKSKLYVAVLPHVGRVLAVAFSVNGTYLASAGSTNGGDEQYTIIVWHASYDARNESNVLFKFHIDDSACNKFPKQIPANHYLHQGNITSLAFQPPLTKTENKGESSVIASSSSDRSVRLWQFHMKDKDADVTPRMIIRHHRDEVTCVSFSEDGHFMVSSSLDASVCVFHLDQTTPGRVTHHSMFNLGVGEQAHSVLVLPGHTNIGDSREYTVIVGTNMSLQVLRIAFAHVKEDPSKHLPQFVTQSLAIQSNRDDAFFARSLAPEQNVRNVLVNYIHISMAARFASNPIYCVAATVMSRAIKKSLVIKGWVGNPKDGDDDKSTTFEHNTILVTTGGRTEVVGWALNHYQNPWTGYGKYFARPSIIGRHTSAGGGNERVTSICLPSLRVHRALLTDQQLLSSRQYYAISSSLDQTVRLWRWGVVDGPQPLFIHPTLLANAELKKEHDAKRLRPPPPPPPVKKDFFGRIKKPKPIEPEIDPYTDTTWHAPLLIPQCLSTTPDNEPHAYVVLQRELTKTQATSETTHELKEEEHKSSPFDTSTTADGRPTAFGTAIILSPSAAQPMPVVFQASDTGAVLWDGQPSFDAESKARASKLEELGALLTFGTKSIPAPAASLGLPAATLAAAPAAHLPDAKMRSATTLGFDESESKGIPPAIALHNDGQELKIGRWARVQGAVAVKDHHHAEFGGTTTTTTNRTAIDVSGARRGAEPDSVAFHGVVGSGQGLSIVEEEEATAAALAYEATAKATTAKKMKKKQSSGMYDSSSDDDDEDDFANTSTLSQFGQLAGKAGGKSSSRACASPAPAAGDESSCIIA